MFEIELKSPVEMSIKAKDRVVDINIEDFTINAGLKVGTLEGAGEYEIGEIVVTGVAISDNKVMYRLSVDGVKIGLVGAGAKIEELDELGPVDVLGAVEPKVVPVVEPKILIPMGNMDFAEIKATVNVEKKLKIKNQSSLPAALTVYKLD